MLPGPARGEREIFAIIHELIAFDVGVLCGSEKRAVVVRDDLNSKFLFHILHVRKKEVTVEGNEKRESCIENKKHESARRLIALGNYQPYDPHPRT